MENDNHVKKDKIISDGKEKKHLRKKITQLKNSRSLQVNKLKISRDALASEKQDMKLTSRKLRDKNILLLKKENQLKGLRQRLRNLTVENINLKGELKKEKKLRYFEMKDHEVKMSTLKSNREQLENELVELGNKNRRLRETINYMETNPIQETENIELFDSEKGCFSTSTELCIHDLLNHSVAMDKVPKVIESVLKLCGKKSERLPSETTIRNINIRKMGLTQMQLSSTLPERPDMTLYSDETSKKGKKYTGYHLSDKGGNMYVLGLREMSDKSSKQTLATFKEILDDIDFVLGDSDQTVGHKILKNIRCTMSDQASTCKSFNELLTDYRSSILPSVQENWTQLTEREKSLCSRMYNFFCGLHILVNLAEVTSKTLQEFELKSEVTKKGAAAESGLVFNHSESGTVRLVRTACKAFTRGADEKSGAYRAFTDFLLSKGKNNKLVNFKGNRFNVLFLDSGLVFFYAQDICYFLDKVHGTPNGLLRSVFADCKCDEFLAGAKALGLLEKLITTPLWRLIESDTHILDMNMKYQHLVEFLDRMSENPASILDGSEKPFPDKTTAEADDTVHCNLLKEQDFDPLVNAILQCILSAWSSYLKHAVKDHLPGGVLAEAKNNDNITELTKSAQKHNKFAERIFGMLDHLVSKRPNATTLANEAFIAFSINKTSEWLESKDDAELQKLIKKGRKVGKQVKVKFNERIKEIQRKNIEVQKQKEAEKERKRVKALKEKEELTKEIEWFGLWQTKSTVIE